MVALNAFFNNKTHATHNIFNKEASIHQIDRMIGCKGVTKFVTNSAIDSIESISSYYIAFSLVMDIEAEK